MVYSERQAFRVRIKYNFRALKRKEFAKIQKNRNFANPIVTNTPIHHKETMITHDLDMALRDAVSMVPENQIFILTDTNTHVHCLPLVQKTLNLPEQQVLCIEAGDANKTLATVEQIWHFLFEHNATRHSVLVNVGGGMVSDIGGFAASTYMRGMKYVNVATTLLSDIDAASGGKTGINYNGIKNGIGLFAQPKSVIICLDFLRTLPPEEFLSGFAEMLKHALISSPLELDRLLTYDIDKRDLQSLETLIQRSIVVKSYIVEQDPEESGMRKTLNFGHTVGHALEQMSLMQNKAMPHGYAVFYGLLAEMYMSVKMLSLNEAVIKQCLPLFYNYYGKPQCSCKDMNTLIELMHHDKKNLSSDKVNCTLLQVVGNARIDRQCDDQLILEALDWLFSL